MLYPLENCDVFEFLHFSLKFFGFSRFDSFDFGLSMLH